jgi:signal transduction histidine kinase
VHATLEPAVISGDPVLAERLIANLVDNAVRYNLPAGDIWISTRTMAGSSQPPSAIRRLLASGAHAYLTKPLDLAELGARLDSVTASAQDHQPRTPMTARPA